VQEALLAIHTQRHTYDPAEPLTPWVYAIARYKLIDHLRRNRASLADVPPMSVMNSRRPMKAVI
jgi:RNA polymerase sigma-70 factor, ECF subfamily